MDTYLVTSSSASRSLSESLLVVLERGFVFGFPRSLACSCGAVRVSVLGVDVPEVSGVVCGVPGCG